MTIRFLEMSKGVFYAVDGEPWRQIDEIVLEKLRVLLNARHGEKLRRERRAKKKKGGK